MYKQVIVVRSDLRMSKGKTAAQVAHASVEAVFKAQRSIVSKWRAEGMKKVVLKVSSLGELEELESLCYRLRLPCALVRDAGHTEIEPGTMTCLGIGPAEEDKIDKVTGSLKPL